MNKKFSTQRHDLCRCVLFHVFLLVTSTLFVPAAFALDGSWRGELRIGSGRLPRSRPWRHARHAGRRPAQPRDRARSHSRGRSPRNGRPQPSFPARRDRRHRRIRHNLRNARARSARARLRLCSRSVNRPEPSFRQGKCALAPTAVFAGRRLSKLTGR